MSRTRINFQSPARGSQFLAADSGIECAVLWHDGTKLWLLISGYTGGLLERERLWVYDRLPGGPHEDKSYSGYWGRNPVSNAPLVYNLNVAGAAIETTADSIEVLRVGTGAQTAAWDALYPPKGGDDLADRAPYTATGPTWRVQLLNALTGAVLSDVTAQEGLKVLPALTSGQSAILRVRSEGFQAVYSWPPPNYQSISGEATATPARFAWTHPTRGTLYFDFRFSVGARPYDRTDPVQATLLDGEIAARENRTARKVPEWVNNLIEFDATGAIVTHSGEWSMARVVAGVGNWIGDENVHAAATLPALWRVELNSITFEPVGSIEPWTLDPTLRAVGVIEIVEDGALLVGGAVAGRSGPAPIILEIQTPDAAGDHASTEKTRAIFSCECATPEGKTIRGIAHTSRGVRAVSPCDSFLRDMSKPASQRLLASHPGGRNSLVFRASEIENYVFTTEGGDFATSGHHQKAHGYIVLDEAGGLKTGAPVAKQLDSCLAFFAGHLFAIEEWSKSGAMPFEQSLSDRLQSYQALGSSNDGAQWQRLVSWQVMDFDAGPVARCSSRRDGAALWTFGTVGEGSLMKPRALRLQGDKVTRNLDLDYFIQRVNTCRIDGEDWMVAVGLKHANGAFGREQFVLLSRGEDPSFVPSPGTPKNASEALDLMPVGTKVSLVPLSAFEDEIGDDGQILQGEVGVVGYYPKLDFDGAIATGGAMLQYETLYPYALWLRVDGDPALQIAPGAAITPAIRAEMVKFDQGATLQVERPLAIPATKRVEALFLLAPNWSIERAKNFKVRG